MSFQSQIMAGGMSAEAAKAVVGSITKTAIATGTNQATALRLGTVINFITTVAAGTGVVLPTMNDADLCVIFNQGANALLVYPPVGFSIDSQAVNVSISVPASTSVFLYGSGNNNYTSKNDLSLLASTASPTTQGAALVANKRSATGALATNVHLTIEGLPPNVKSDYGASGDGITNDTSFFTNAFDGSNGRKTLVPFGQYIIPTSLLMDGALHTGYDGLILEGQGWDWTRRSGGTELLFSGATGPLWTIQGNPALVQLNQVVIKDMSIRASNAALAGALMRVCHVANVLFENCNFEANAAGTLIEGDNWITVRFKHCRFYKAAIGVITSSISGFGGAYANLVKFEDCWFDKLTKSTDFTYAGRTVVFDHCVWEPTSAGAASPNLVGGYDASFNECWFGDGNGTGTWITATGERLKVTGSDMTGGAISIDMATTFGGVIENNNLDGTTSPVKLRATKNGRVINNRILLTTNNSVGVDMTSGSGHWITDNNVTKSGSPTGTIGYRVAAGVSGLVRDLSPGTADTLVDNSSVLMNFDLLDYQDNIYNLFEDHFLGDVLADQWNGRVGSDGACVTPTISVAANGMVRLVTGAGAGATMVVNGVQLDSALNWQPNLGGFQCDFKVKTSAQTSLALFVGMTGQTAALQMPIEGSGVGDGITTNASNAFGFLYDSTMTTKNWWIVGVASDVDATSQNSTFAPITGTYERFRIDVTTAGVATFWRNGVQVGTAMTGAVTAATALTPVIAAYSRSAASRNIDCDRVRLRQRH